MLRAFLGGTRGSRRADGFAHPIASPAPHVYCARDPSVKIPVGIKVFVDAAGVDPAYARIIHKYVLSGAFWLLFATAGGLLDAFRFVMPELLEVSWLSFGRVRPMHTSAALWGWASLALLGVSHYVVPRSCRTTLYSIKLARI